MPDAEWQQGKGFEIKNTCGAYAPCVVNGAMFMAATCELAPHDPKEEMHKFTLRWK